MKSVLSSAVLGAVAFSHAVSAISIPHGHAHAHLHRRDAVATNAAPLEKRTVDFMSTADVSLCDSKGIKTGKNIPSSKGGPVTVGDDGPFLVQLKNESPDDIIVVSWSGSGQWGSIMASFVGATQPDVTHTLKSNSSTWISFDPDKAEGKAISGALAAIYPSGQGSGLTTFSGQLDNTWLEFTFTTLSGFSTTDVSRLVNMSGRKIEAFNYKSKDDKEPVCATTMDKCVYVCTDGTNACMVGKIVGCPVGTAGTTSNESGMDGGCAGMSDKGGFVKIIFG